MGLQLHTLQVNDARLQPVATKVLAGERLSAEDGIALYESHDLLAVASLCSRIAILQRGQIVETGSTEQMFRDPRTADTRALLQAVLRNSSAAAEFSVTAEATVRR